MAIFKLTPNCLLTRYPIFFLTPWKGTVKFIRNHGYDVQVIEDTERLQTAGPHHLFFEGDSDFWFPETVSSTSVKKGHEFHTRLAQREAKAFGPVVRTYQGWIRRQFFLQHCIFLAEYDLTASK